MFRYATTMTLCRCFPCLGPKSSDSVKWERWWLPNTQYLGSPRAEESKDYFSYIISPDCSTCDVANNNEKNYLSSFNTDDFGDRTAYHMTGTIFGCVTSLKGNKDCVWNYQTYECSVCSRSTSDQGTT